MAVTQNGANAILIVSISLIPGARDAIGKAAYLGAFITVFAHPGRRFGQLTEALILALGGTISGLAWSIFGIYLGSLMFRDSPPAAYAIRAVFLALAVLFHGFLRSRTPRVFTFVLLFIIVSVVNLTSVNVTVTNTIATQIIYPVFIAGVVVLLVNLFIFPEFSSKFLGELTIQMLNEAANALEQAGNYFIKFDIPDEADAAKDFSSDKSQKRSIQGKQVLSIPKSNQKEKTVGSARVFKKLFSRKESSNEQSTKPNHSKAVSIGELTACKGKLRKKLMSCDAAQMECNFEIAFSVLPPRSIRPISGKAMRRLISNIVAVIGACESKYALVGEAHDEEPDLKCATSMTGVEIPQNMLENQGLQFGQPRPSSGSSHAINQSNPSSSKHQKSLENHSAEKEKDEIGLNVIKPAREIEFANPKLLNLLLLHVRKPYRDLFGVVSQTTKMISTCIAQAYVCCIMFRRFER